MKIRSLAVLALLAVVGPSCVVYVEDPPPRRRVVVYHDAPPSEVVVQQSPDEVEVNDVVYREYYGCTDEEIYLLPHYRHYYALTDDDIYFIYFCARRSNVSFDVCFHSYYYDCGRNYDRLVVTYNVPREHFFVSVGVGVTTYPPVYQRTYACYNSGSYASVTFTNHEYVALVQMRVACDYQGHPPGQYFARVQATGSPSRVIVESRDQCGHGGHTATGAAVTVQAQRPWTMPPQQKQQWHEQQRQNSATAQASFQQRHPEQVQKVQAKEHQAAANHPQGQQQHGTPAAKPAVQQNGQPQTGQPQNGQPQNGQPQHVQPGTAHAKQEVGPDGKPIEKHPNDPHPQAETKKKPPPEEHEKKGEKEK
jgi:hypothetical protein